MLEVYLITLAGVSMGQAAPGPNLLAVAGVALGQGRRPAVFTALGVALAILIWVALIALGLTAVFNLYPALLTVMKLVGGGYLLWIAFRGAKAAVSGSKPSIKAIEDNVSNMAAFRHGFLVNMTNPKSALMWSAVATFMFGSGLSDWQVLLFAPIGAFTAFCIYGTYGLLFSSGLARSLYARAARWFEAAFAAAFGLIGGKLFLDGLRELKQ